MKYPGFSRDIVSFGIVRDIKIDGGRVKLTIAVTTRDPDVPGKLENDARRAIEAINGVESVEVAVSVQTPKPAPQASGHTARDGREPALPGVKHVVAVASGKGGVGKSTFAVNLACAIERVLSSTNPDHKGVGIMDCDIHGPSVPLMMGVGGQPEIQDDRIFPQQNFGVKVMSMGLLVDEDSPVVWRGPMVTNAILQFIQNVEWGDLDVLVVDLPPGTGDAQLTLVQTIPVRGAVIVTTPQQAAVNVARRGARMFGKVNVPLLGVAENMSYLLNPDGSRTHVFGKGGGARTAQDLDTVLLGEIPLDPIIREGGDRGIPIVVSEPDSPAGKEFLRIAESILLELKKSV